MAWTTPMTAVSGAFFTASQFNTYVRNNLNETEAAKATAAGRHFVPTGANSIAERRTVSAFDDSTLMVPAAGSFLWVDGGGPSVSVVTGTAALIFMGGRQANEGDDKPSGIAFTVSGATNDPLQNNATWEADHAIGADGLDPSTGTGNAVRQSTAFLKTDLTPGTNVFTMVYLQSDTGNCYYASRELIVMAF